MEERAKPVRAPAGPGRDPLETVLRYHQETKHHFSHFARGPAVSIGRINPIPSGATKEPRCLSYRC